jgi:hypothetical protein
MDSNAAHFLREDDKDCPSESGSPAAEERTRLRGLAPQAAGEACPGCLCNTRGNSSLLRMEGYPDYLTSGGIDWFEWWALVHWNDAERWHRAFKAFQDVKELSQKRRVGFIETQIPDFGPVRVRRVGFNRGGDRGQHFEYSLQIPGVSIGIGSRDISPKSSARELSKAQPNFVAKQSGRDCLLFGAQEGYAMTETLLSAIGGEAIVKRISRGDLCLDIVNLDSSVLLDLVRNGQFVTRASRVRREVDLVTDKETGFSAGKYPLYMTVYNKLHERIGKTDMLYHQALVDRRWGGVVPDTATRVEYQLGRRWLREQGIDSPDDFLRLRGKLCEKLTHEWFRITARKIERRRKHQSREKIHPIWTGIQNGFQAVFGPPEGDLVPLQRNKVRPIELIRQGRRCLANSLLQMGVEFSDYPEFVRLVARLLMGMFPGSEERNQFLEEVRRWRMEYEVS